MSRAFVRESDDAPDLPIARQSSPLPPGAKNYMTATGAERLRGELQQLVETERPQLAQTSDDPDVKRKLLVLDQRIGQLEESLGSAEVVQPGEEAPGAVRFGASVIVRNRRAEELRYRIVGVDETDFDDDAVSWISPIARALTGAKIGQRVRFRFPSGEEELEIVAIRYE